jgi:hypothetical protein
MTARYPPTFYRGPIHSLERGKPWMHLEFVEHTEDE